MTAKDIAEKKHRTAKEINESLRELEFVEKCSNGYKVTELGKKNGGIQKFYMGKSFVEWDKSILENEALSKALNLEEQTEPNTAEEIDFRKKFEAKHRTKSGHYVRSRAEMIIANWLLDEYIAFAYERKVPIAEEMYCDFYIPKGKIYIEFWGLENDEKYKKRKQRKQNLYKEKNLNLIEIDDDAICNLDDYLPKELLKFGVKID